MWQRFTERARKVVFYAQEEARGLGEDTVSTEHLLLGLIRESDSVAGRILDRLGVSRGRIRQEVMRKVTKRGESLGTDLQLTPSAKRVIDLAYDEAKLLNNDYIGTEHLLLALIHDDDGIGIAANVLAKLKVNLEEARVEVKALQDAAFDELLNVDEAAKFLSVSKPTLYRLIGEDAIKGVKVGKRWRFRKDILNAYLRRSPESVPSAPEALIDGEIAFFRELLAISGGLSLPLADSVKPVDETRESTDISERKTEQLAQLIIRVAISQGASDIHLEGIRDDADLALRIRNRVDGVMHDVRTLPAPLRDPLIARFKTMAEMVVSEKRLPQDGRIPARLEGSTYDIRVSVVPTVNGESMVMRVLAHNQVLLHLDQMGLLTPDRAALDALLALPNGLVLCTGPTGSGKTTLLYSLIGQVNEPSRKVMSVEDPVEFTLPGVNQIQVNARTGLTFSSALRTVFRQDPDVILVAELRDEEMARMALEAALTGHLVLSTLHTKGTVDAIIRLRDLGIEPFYISGALAGITAQRLCRRLCPECKVPAKSLDGDPIWSRVLELSAEGGWKVPPDAVFYKGAGCDKCRGKGYRGRVAIYEVLTMTEKLAVANAESADGDELRALAIEGGMKTLWADGIRKASEGLTTIEEIARVIGVAGM